MRAFWREITSLPDKPMPSVRVIVTEQLEPSGVTLAGADNISPLSEKSVLGPTEPYPVVAGEPKETMLWTLWYFSTATCVSVPKYPVGWTERKPSETRSCWRELTSLPDMPKSSVRSNARAEAGKKNAVSKAVVAHLCDMKKLYAK